VNTFLIGFDQRQAQSGTKRTSGRLENRRFSLSGHTQAVTLGKR